MKTTSRDRLILILLSAGAILLTLITYEALAPQEDLAATYRPTSQVLP